ncbi:response regulator transcription factor [Robbsia andropogonis]|nr:response regulator transcription factor [Robbsia andropogonis]MCP1121110.1 response regulator transcription factor [Robbsia andropogonis]MCP1130890.1 response regulator transcription factor [Robbsia andropogonis]
MNIARESAKARAWRVVLVDDHPLVREAYGTLIEAQPDMTVLASLGDSASLTNVLRHGGADIVLLDLQLSDDDVDGIALIQRLRVRFNGTRILVCSALDDPITTDAVFNAGAHGFLSKRQSVMEMIDALYIVAAGKRYLSERTDDGRDIGSNGLTGVPALAKDTALNADLTTKEYDVLRCCRQGLSPTRAAAKLKRSVKTVSGHKMMAFRKLGYATEVALHHATPRAKDR